MDAEFEAAVSASLQSLALSREAREQQERQLVSQLQESRVASARVREQGGFWCKVQIPAGMIGKIVGPSFTETNRIADKIGGVSITATRDPLEFIIHASSNEKCNEAEDAVLVRIWTVCAADAQLSRGPTPEPRAGGAAGVGERGRASRSASRSRSGSPRRALADERFRHIFIDNSNIWINAQHSFDGTGVRRVDVRLNVGGLDRVLSASPHGSETTDRYVSGSRPPETDGIWDAYRRSRYHVEVHARDPATGREEVIDTVTHAAMYRLTTEITGSILQGECERGEHTIVLGTGDGNDNHGARTNFAQVAENAAKCGIRVEVWAWNRGLSGVYRALQRKYPDLISIHLLDDHKLQVSYCANPPLSPDDVRRVMDEMDEMDEHEQFQNDVLDWEVRPDVF